MDYVFMGYDPREHFAYSVAEYSLKRRSTDPVTVVALKHKELRAKKLFNRKWYCDEGGQFYDALDHKPMSTEFSFTRFLTPIIAQEHGIKDWVLFVDCDFLFLTDMTEVFNNVRSLGDDFAAACVKHKFPDVAPSLKMDNVRQEYYARKGWSSFIFFNMNHPSMNKLTVEDVNTKSGQWLHGLSWLEDKEIADLPCTYNYIPELYGPRDLGPKIIHYSITAPWFPGQEDCAYSEKWHREVRHMSRPRPTEMFQL